MMLFERWARQFAREGMQRVAGLRRMALNGSEQNRRLLIRVDDLDSRTLEVLAKQGPADVRLAVAQHPNLHEELAKSLLENERIVDPAFKAALRHRLAAWRAEDVVDDEVAIGADSASTATPTDYGRVSAAEAEIPTPPAYMVPTSIEPVEPAPMSAVAHDPEPAITPAEAFLATDEAGSPAHEVDGV
ncbi:MAG: hypothetical protein LC667_16640, partial [Thioalkalivibrio sp.]|nr:hypothetical protein [Thioalkalivibrio sp.]